LFLSEYDYPILLYYLFYYDRPIIPLILFDHLYKIFIILKGLSYSYNCLGGIYLKKLILAITIMAICCVLVAPSFAAPKATLPERSTWDLDMIDCDSVPQTGKNVYVAVLDTGLAPNWKDYFPEGSILTYLGKGFKENLKWDEASGKFIESGVVREISYTGTTGETHGTHVTSTIIGYNYYTPTDAAQGYPLSPVFVRGVAPDAKIIPVKVLSDYHIGTKHLDDVDYTEQHIVFGTDRAVAAGIDYATSLYKAGYQPMIITMSLGGPTDAKIIDDAIDRAVAAGVIVVASAGNEGTLGMGYPGAYEPVISVGACGWKYEWYHPELVSPEDAGKRYRLWWLQDETYGYNDISEPVAAGDVYITDWSSRELPGQDLDVVAPGSWVRGPYPGNPGYSHLPWWSNGHPKGIVAGGSFFYVGGTSMACPHVTGLVALILEKNPTLKQEAIEILLEDTAMPIPAGSMTVWDLTPAQGWYTYSWSDDATGAGLVQAMDALAAA
jgi:subtilisin family serine protease